MRLPSIAPLTLLIALPFATACAHTTTEPAPTAPVTTSSDGSASATPETVAANERTVRLNRDELVNTGGWQLSSARSGDAETASTIRAGGADFVLTFDGERVSARGGCNTLRGTYTLGGKRMRFDLAVATRMACKDDGNRADSRFAELMGQEFKAELLEPQPYRLRLTADDGTVLEFTAKPMSL